MKDCKKVYIYGFLLVLIAGCVSCAGKTATDGNATVSSDVTENVPDALDVILGESDEDLLVMGEGNGTEEIAKPGENGLPIEGEGSEIVPGPVIIYYNSQDFTQLVCEEVSVNSITPESVLKALAAHHIVTIDTKHNAFGMQDTEDGRKGLFLDLNKKFAEYMGTMTEDSEKIILAALADTFLKNYDAELLYLSVEGAPLKTLHRIYADPFTWSDYEVEEDPFFPKNAFDKKDEEK